VLTVVTEGSTTLIIAGVLLVSLVVLGGAYRILRKALVSTGILRTKLDEIANAIVHAMVASVAVAVPLMLVLFFWIKWWSTQLGVWDTIDEVHVVSKFVVSLALIALLGYMGWLIWGRRVYSRRVSELNE
jgi:hypothetical protein